MRILILQFVPDVRGRPVPRFERQLGTLLSLLVQRGHELSLLGLARFDVAAVKAALARGLPQLIYADVSPVCVDVARRTLQYVQEHEFIAVVAGGGYPTIDPATCLSLPSVQAVAIGEPDASLVTYLERIKDPAVGQVVMGVWARDERGLDRPELPELVEDLDSLPFPERDLFGYDEYVRRTGEIEVAIARGCPQKCAYCVNDRLAEMYAGRGTWVRRRSPENVLGEIDLLRQKYEGVRIVRFLDHAFALDPGWLAEFLDTYASRCSLPFRCHLRANAADEQTVLRLAAASCKLVDIELISASDFIRNEIFDMELSGEQITGTFGWLRAAGIRTRVIIYLGAPYESEASLEDSRSLLRALKPDAVDIRPCYPWPGVRATETCRENGWLHRRGEEQFRNDLPGIDMPACRPEKITPSLSGCGRSSPPRSPNLAGGAGQVPLGRRSASFSTSGVDGPAGATLDRRRVIHYQSCMLGTLAATIPLLLAQATSIPATGSSSIPAEGPLVQDPAGILAVLLAVLAVIFWMTQHRVLGRVFKVIPALVFCYFVPTTLTTLGVIPDKSPLYEWVKDFILPASLLLLILALDVPGILRLGPKAGIMLLAGTTGVVIGGPISLFICQQWLPEDAWKGMAALAGSWIGGGANFVAIGKSAGASDAMLATMVIPDVFVASIWMGVLLYLSGHQHRIDGWTGANARAIRDLEHRLTEFQARVTRVPLLPDLMIILAFGFVGSWISYAAGHEMAKRIAASAQFAFLGEFIPATTWKYIIVTTLGVILSFTPARRLEGAGASKLGSVMIYLLVACIGAHADFAKILQAPAYIVMGFVWIAFHIIMLLGVGWLIKAPIFFVAVGSQSNIGGAASAPVVAAAYHPSLAPVGALLAVAGYVLGTYAGLICMHMLRAVAHAGGG